MKRSLRTLGFVALVLMAAPVLADAPRTQYKEFTRDTDTIDDTLTLLSWRRFDARTRKPYDAAQLGCTSWSGRLPTVKELLTLVDEQPFQTFEFGATVQKAIDFGAFGNHTSVDAPYWTSTPTGMTDQVWGVDFKDGTMVPLNKKDTTGFYVRCVK